MKHLKRNIFLTILTLVIAAVYYYVTLPAINIHSADFWFFLMALIAVCLVVYAVKKAGKEVVFQQTGRFGGFHIDLNSFHWKEYKGIKFLLVLLVDVFGVYLVGSILSSPIVNAKKYQQLLTIEERNFTDDIKEVDYNTIPLLDKDSAALLGNRKMGSLVDMVSQFEVSSDYTQINYQGKPVRVTPLRYASPIKWLTNRKQGLPAYMLIDMATQDTECVKLSEGIKYSKSEYFNRYIYRHLRFRYPT